MKAGPPNQPDRFELVGSARHGGEGIAWRARFRGDTDAGPWFAVKQLRRPPGVGPDWPTAADLQRWQDHRILLASLNVPRLVPTLDVFLADGGKGDGPGVPYVVMPWISGPTLAEKVADAPITDGNLDERLALVEDLAHALGGLHARSAASGNSLLHNDVKPSNCIIDPADGLILVDLGGLRLLEEAADRLGMHTAGYAAPEVLRDPCAPRSTATDIYALGAVAYYCLTGVGPPAASCAAYLDISRNTLATTVNRLLLTDSDALIDQVLTAMDPNPAARPTDPVAWVARLRRLAAPPPARRRPCVTALWALLLTAAVVALPAQELPGRAGAAPAYSSQEVRITSPGSGQDVRGCQAFLGTSDLRPDRTMVLTRRSASANDRTRWAQPVENWQQPDRLRSWYGYQFFGDASAVGDDFVVEVFVADRAVLLASWQRALAAGEKWKVIGVPADWQLAAAVTVHRVPGFRRC
ncbi:serine/threonine protein kinase [Cryptosporangium sp. NPDC048952]|uniref:serine/threonine protein kinase n=1 Tax=Cryptosporangium sp. NPDC048952 TaxID=3363961 RepID=UPI00370FE395